MNWRTIAAKIAQAVEGWLAPILAFLAGRKSKADEVAKRDLKRELKERDRQAEFDEAFERVRRDPNVRERLRDILDKADPESDRRI